MKKGTQPIVLSFVLILVMTGIGWAETKPIIIGNPNAFSGMMSMYGNGAAVGIELAIEEINAAGGVLGRPFKLIKRDTRLNPEVAVREVKDLVLNEDADFIIGILSSGVGLAVSEYCRSAKKILIILEARSTKITEEKGHRYVFRFCSNFSSRDSAVLDAAARLWPKNETDKVCQLNLDYEQGKNAYQDTMKKWKKANPNMELVTALWPPLGTSDWAPYISKLMASEGNILIHALYGGAWMAFVKQALPMGLYQKFHVVGSCAGDLETTHTLKEGSPIPVGMVTIAEWPYWAIKDPKAQEMADRIMKKGGLNYASSHAYAGYLAVYTLKEAIEKVGAVDTEKIVSYMEGKKIESNMGPMTIRACDHQLTWPVYAGKLEFIPELGWPSVKEPSLPDDVAGMYNPCEDVVKLRQRN